MKGMVKILCFVAVLTAATASGGIAADVAVIVNRSNSGEVTRAMVEKIYKGELTVWPGGGAIVPLDLPETSETRIGFCQQVLGKSVSVMKAFWSVKLFSGKATPPKVLNTEEEVRSFVANNKNAIGYVASANADASVKTVVTVK